MLMHCVSTQRVWNLHWGERYLSLYIKKIIIKHFLVTTDMNILNFWPYLPAQLDILGNTLSCWQFSEKTDATLISVCWTQPAAGQPVSLLPQINMFDPLWLNKSSAHPPVQGAPGGGQGLGHTWGELGLWSSVASITSIPDLLSPLTPWPAVNPDPLDGNRSSADHTSIVP